MRWWPALAPFAVLLAGPALAGTPDSPELTDPRGDVAVAGIVGVPEAAGEAVDVVALWVNDTADLVRFHVAVASLAALPALALQPASSGVWWADFRVVDAERYSAAGNARWSAQARLDGAGGMAFFLHDPTGDDPAGTFHQVAGGVDEARGWVWVDVPRSLMALDAGGTVESLYANAMLTAAGPASVGDDGTAGSAWYWVAPPGDAPAPYDPPPAKGTPALPIWAAAAGLALLAMARRR